MTIQRFYGSLAAQLLFWAAATFAFVMAILPHPPAGPSDKIQHIIAFATLAALSHVAFPRAVTWRLIGGLSAFGATIEIVQAIPFLHRDCEFLDWVADTCAAFAVLTVLRTVDGRKVEDA